MGFFKYLNDYVALSFLFLQLDEVAQANIRVGLLEKRLDNSSKEVEFEPWFRVYLLHMTCSLLQNQWMFQ
jgi:hypothetical protein